MHPSPVLLETYFFEELHFISYLDYEDRDEVIALKAEEIRVDVEPFQSKENGNKWFFKVTIELPEAPDRKYPYSFKAIVAGFFEVHADYPEELKHQLILSNGPGLLYSATREAIAMITGRGPYGPVLLPSVSFVKPRADVKVTKKQKSPKAVSRDSGQHKTKPKTTRRSSKP